MMQWLNLLSIAGPILNLSVCLCATIGYCLGGGHEGWLLPRQLSFTLGYTWVDTHTIQSEWVIHYLSYVCTLSTWKHIFVMTYTFGDVHSGKQGCKSLQIQSNVQIISCTLGDTWLFSRKIMSYKAFANNTTKSKEPKTYSHPHSFCEYSSENPSRQRQLLYMQTHNQYEYSKLIQSQAPAL